MAGAHRGGRLASPAATKGKPRTAPITGHSSRADTYHKYWSEVRLEENCCRRTKSNPFRKNTALCKAQRLIGRPSIARSRSLNLMPLDLANCIKLILNRSSDKGGSLLGWIGCCEGRCVIRGDCCSGAPLFCPDNPLESKPLAGTCDEIWVKSDCGIADDTKFCCGVGLPR